MGCNIHTYVEVKRDGRWTPFTLEKSVFDWRSYRLYGWLANVRNYSMYPHAFEGRGWPDDVSEETVDKKNDDDFGFHSFTYCTLAELANYDYSQVFEDRRTTVTHRNALGGSSTNGAAIAGIGEGMPTTLKAFLGEGYFSELDRLKYAAKGYKPDEIRILMCFDN